MSVFRFDPAGVVEIRHDDIDVGTGLCKEFVVGVNSAEVAWQLADGRSFRAELTPSQVRDLCAVPAHQPEALTAILDQLPASQVLAVNLNAD